jgi:site-specific recombinase XerD
VGQKRAFTLDELALIEGRLLADENWHDLALLSFGLDTIFRASDLLATQVWQVCYRQGTIRTMIARRQQKTQAIVNPVLTPPTRAYLQRWLTVSGKRAEDFVFTRSKPIGGAPITRAHYADIIKTWAGWLDHERGEFSSHSIRRSKPSHMYWAGEDIALISRLLGHKSIANTIEYLGITQHKAELAALRHSMLRGFGDK